MGPIAVALLIVFVLGAAVGAYALLAPRRKSEHCRSAERVALHTGTGWTLAAGEEFAGLPEPARCDMIFAIAALGDERSQRLLAHALDDPAEAVALAAAHALCGHGGDGVVQQYLQAHPGQRADRIAETLSLLASEG